MWIVEVKNTKVSSLKSKSIDSSRRTRETEETLSIPTSNSPWRSIALGLKFTARFVTQNRSDRSVRKLICVVTTRSRNVAVNMFVCWTDYTRISHSPWGTGFCARLVNSALFPDWHAWRTHMRTYSIQSTAMLHLLRHVLTNSAALGRLHAQVCGSVHASAIKLLRGCVRGYVMDRGFPSSLSLFLCLSLLHSGWAVNHGAT